MGEYVVYKHQTPSGKVYIGLTRQAPEARWKNGWGYYTSVSFYRAIRKYGWVNISHEIVASGLTAEEASEIERATIRAYDSTNPNHGYNLTDGGEHYSQGEESRKRLSESLKRFYVENPGARIEISERQRGRASSPSANEKRSETMKQFYRDHPEKKALCGNSFRGKSRSNSTRSLMSIHSAVARQIICVETGERFNSIYEASRKSHVHRNGISNVLNGRAKTAGGYKWKYADEKVSEDNGE